MTVERKRPCPSPHTPRSVSPCPASPLAHTPGKDRPEGTGGAQATAGMLGRPLCPQPPPPLCSHGTSGEAVGLKHSFRWAPAFATQMPSEGGWCPPSSWAPGARPEAEDARALGQG